MGTGSNNQGNSTTPSKMEHPDAQKSIHTFRIIIFFTLLFALTIQQSFAQEKVVADSLREEAFNYKKIISLAAVSSLFTATMIDSYLAWWKGNYQPFGFYDASKLGGWFYEPAILGIDKIGHFYGAYFLYRTKKNILLWGGYSDETASWIALGFTAGVGLMIEIGDGFSSYAFDFRDLIMDASGIGYAMLQDKIPFLQNFNFKFSYYQSDKLSLRFTQHYDACVFWFAADTKNIFSSSKGTNAFDFIQPAIGFSVGDKGSHREFLFGLDFNLNSLFPSDDKNWDLIRKTLNLFHLPAPGIKFAPGRAPEYRLLLFN